MLGFIALALLVWVALIVVGFVFKSLFWLVIVGAVLFIATAAFGWVKRRT